MAPHKKNPAAVALGSIRSAAKAKASRANGNRGGRPREALPCLRCGTATTERDASRRPWCGC